MTTILIADDHPKIVQVLSAYAKKEGYDVIVAQDGEEALDVFRREKIDLILLDIMMPKVDGYEVCREIRKTSNVPIIMVTARGEDFERIMGLDIGADDYIIKPFAPGEVMARIRAILRRIVAEESKVEREIKFENLRVDIDNYEAEMDGEDLGLTKKELEILWTLADARGKVFSRENLLNSVWGYDYYGDSRTVDTHIKRLRAKMDKHPHPGYEIATIWGVGYKFEVKDED